MAGKKMRKEGLGGRGLLRDGRSEETGMQGDSEEPDSRSSPGSAVNKEQAAVEAAFANLPFNTFTIPNDSGWLSFRCVRGLASHSHR